MDFGDALKALKNGEMVQREGWNGKGMHIYLENHFGVCMGQGGMKHTRGYDPVICMFTAQKTHQPGWLASQADMLADDWRVLSYDDAKVTE